MLDEFYPFRGVLVLVHLDLEISGGNPMEGEPIEGEPIVVVGGWVGG